MEDPPADEPDPRFLLAAERTFLAWLRTALALLAAGLGTAFLPETPGTALRVLATALLVLGLVASATAAPRWQRQEVALRRGTPLPGGRAARLIGHALTLTAAISIAAVLLA